MGVGRAKEGKSTPGLVEIVNEPNARPLQDVARDIPLRPRDTRGGLGVPDAPPPGSCAVRPGGIRGDSGNHRVLAGMCRRKCDLGEFPCAWST